MEDLSWRKALMFIIKQTEVGASIIYEIMRNRSGSYSTFKDAVADLERDGAKRWSKISGSSLYIKSNDDQKEDIQI